MSKTYPYPEQEHLETPRTIPAILEEELRIYPDGESFRRGTLAIGQIYEATHVMKSIVWASQLMNLASVSIGKTVAFENADPDFFAGATLGLHSMYRAIGKEYGRYILNADCLPGFDPERPNEGNALTRIVDDLNFWHDVGAPDFLEQQDDDIQEIIMKTQLRTYGDTANAREREDSFLAGMTYIYRDAANTL